MKAKAIVFHEFGNPPDVLQLGEQTVPSPSGGQALLDVLAAPINPADINTIQGTYGIRPELPTTPGAEGVGIVRAIGPDVKTVKSGDRVLLPHGTGSWRSACLTDSARLVVVPDAVPVEQAAMLWVNPPTAYRMLHDFVTLRPGDWFIQNAANSGVGTAAIQIAKAKGWKSVNVVRREALVAELEAQGADVVLVDGPDLATRVREATGGAPISLALNAVGGENATHCAKCLATNGTMVTYGNMSRQSLKVSAGALIFKNLHFVGIWINKWYRTAPREVIASMFAEIFPLFVEQKLKVPIDSEFALEDHVAAVTRAMESGRDGKVLFRSPDA
jgi:trans-2-enoyl-CoA reductase